MPPLETRPPALEAPATSKAVAAPAAPPRGRRPVTRVTAAVSRRGAAHSLRTPPRYSPASRMPSGRTGKRYDLALHGH